MIKRSVLTFFFSAAMVLGLGTAASAQNGVDGCPLSPLDPDCVGVLPSAPDPVVAAPSAPDPVVAAPSAPAPAGPATTVTTRQTLPVTGTETTVLAIGGLVLVAAGGALVWRSQRVTA